MRRHIRPGFSPMITTPERSEKEASQRARPTALRSSPRWQMRTVRMEFRLSCRLLLYSADYAAKFVHFCIPRLRIHLSRDLHLRSGPAGINDVLNQLEVVL